MRGTTPAQPISQMPHFLPNPAQRWEALGEHAGDWQVTYLDLFGSDITHNHAARALILDNHGYTPQDLRAACLFAPDDGPTFAGEGMTTYARYLLSLEARAYALTQYQRARARLTHHLLTLIDGGATTEHAAWHLGLDHHIAKSLLKEATR